MTQSITPVGHRVVVKLKKIAEEEVSDGGIIIAHQAGHMSRQRAMQEAYVEAIGQTAFKDFGGDPWCKEGDLVLIVRHSGEDRIDEESGDVYRVINDEDICAI